MMMICKLTREIIGCGRLLDSHGPLYLVPRLSLYEARSPRLVPRILGFFLRVESDGCARSCSFGESGTVG